MFIYFFVQDYVWRCEFIEMIPNHTDINNDKLLGTVLYLNKIKESCGRGIISFENNSIKKLVELSVQICLQNSQDKHIKINLSGVEDINVQFNFWFMQQAVANIITNAIHHSPKYGEIIIKSYKNEKHVVLSFRDFGKGINAEALNFLFDEALILKHDCSEFGRNLLIAKTITEAHKGFITAETKTGAGSTFLMHLPIES